FGDEEPDFFDTIDCILSKPSSGNVDFIGDGVVINGRSCFHRAPTPQKMKVSFSPNIMEIKRSFSYASLSEDLNGNPDDIITSDNENSNSTKDFSTHSSQVDNENPKCLKKRNSIEILKESKRVFATRIPRLDNKNPKCIRKRNSIEILNESRREFSTHSPKLDNENPKCIKKRNSMEILEEPRREYSEVSPRVDNEKPKCILEEPKSKSYSYSHEYMSDDGFPDDEYPKEYRSENQNVPRRGSLASAVSMASAMGGNASYTGVGCLTFFIAKILHNIRFLSSANV
ncbi:unnamed protein product, partial [Meganyctiphanes norvegica]